MEASERTETAADDAETAQPNEEEEQEPPQQPQSTSPAICNEKHQHNGVNDDSVAEMCAPTACPPRCAAHDATAPQQQIEARQEEEPQPQHYHDPNEPAFGLRQRKSSQVVKAPLRLIPDDDDGEEDWEPLHNHHKPTITTTMPPLPKRKRIKSWASEGEVHRILRHSFQDLHPSSSYDTDDELDNPHHHRVHNHNDNDDDEMEDVASSFLFQAAPTPRRRTNSSVVTAAALALKHGKALQHSGSSPRYQLNRSGVEMDESELPPLPVMSTTTRNSATTTTTQSTPQSAAQQKYVNPYLIPVQHPLKVWWDVLTVLLSIYNAYLTHKSLKSRQFGNSGWIQAWFVVDILLNFATQRHTADGTLLTSFTAVWARYLTSWFVIDVLALFPGESLYIAPLVELQRRRKLWNKVLRRSKLTVKITTRILQSGYVSWLYKCFIKARGLRDITRVIKQIVYWVRWVVRYFSFVKHMKGLFAIRLLRDWGHLRSAFRWNRRYYYAQQKDDGSTVDLTSDEDAPHASSSSQRAGPSWEYVDDEDDAVPF